MKSLVTKLKRLKKQTSEFTSHYYNSIRNFNPLDTIRETANNLLPTAEEDTKIELQHPVTPTIVDIDSERTTNC